LNTYSKYLRFNDFWFTIFAIPIIAVLVPFLFFGTTLDEYLKNPLGMFVEGSIYTSGFWFFNRYMLIFMRRRFPDFQDALKRNIIQLCVAFVGNIIISVTLGIILFSLKTLVDNFPGNDHKETGSMLGIYVITITIIAIYEAVYFFKQYEQSILEKEQMKTAHVQTQLTNLRNQVNPHFLFNSLNTLMNLIPVEAQNAQNYLNKLSKFYRYAVGNRTEQVVSLDEEIENVKLYAELLKERFGENIHFKFDLKHENQVQILPLTLQLLIENAVKHNIVSANKPLHIHIITNEKHLTISNNLHTVEIVESKNEFQVIIPLINHEGHKEN